MAQAGGTSALAVAAAGAGVLLVYSGLKGASVLAGAQSILQGTQPTDAQTRPISHEIAQAVTGAGGLAATVASSSAAALILKTAEERRGIRYCFGGGHTTICGGRCWDCSGYVSCVLSRAGALKGGPLATGGLARWGRGVPYAQRLPGDVIVWLGGAGNGHTGIIATVSDQGGTMWNNSCSACPTNYVHLSHYPYGTRTAAAAIIRRAT